MAVYDIDGNQLNTVYDVNDNQLSQAYDIDGNELLSGLDDLLPNRLLIWHDEFGGNNVDPFKWNHLYGYYNANRYYMYENDLAHNAYCEDSVLHINNIKDSTMPNTPWTGAFIHTNDLFEFRYGMIEAKIKFPVNTDVYHSTFWTLGANYHRISNVNTQGDETKGVLASTCGEIDIAEADNGTVSTTKHWAVPSTNSHRSGGHKTITLDSANWHIYGCEWTEEEISIYIDRMLVDTWNVTNATVEDFNAFRHPHFLMFNQNPYLNGTQTQSELETLVDWVRVYAPIGVKRPVIETAINIPSSASISVGERHWLGTPTFTPPNPSDMTIIWTSQDESVVTCYGGMLIGVSQGTANVQARSKHGYTAVCEVTVA